MFKRVISQDRPVNFKNYRGRIEVLFDRRVYSYILDSIARHPGQEEGGKYIGYLVDEGHASLQDKTALGLSGAALVVTDFLPSGPNAKRTAVEFMPDGEYQENVFRHAERLDSNVEHLGSWHTHHCNGLERLSEGDIEGYFRTVNKAHYRPNFFVASLVKKVPSRNMSVADWIDHFLFVRGLDEFYRITDNVRLVDFPTVFGSCTGHTETSPSPDTEAAQARQEESGDGNIEWYTTEEGRRVLANDKGVFIQHFGPRVQATRQNSRITLIGELEGKTVSLRYPSNRHDMQVVIYVRKGRTSILEIRSELSDRLVALTAAVAAANSI